MIVMSLSQLAVGNIQPVYAANTETIPPASQFCGSINSIGSRMQSKLVNITDTSGVSVNSVESLLVRQSNIQKDLEQNRIKWDEERNQQYDKMLSLAQNETQKTAIMTFKISVENAIVIRRQSVDLAITEYFSQARTLLQREESQLVGARSEFVMNITKTIDTAESDCSANKSPSEIRTNFQTNIATAQNKLQKTRESINTTKSELEKIRKQEMQTINQALQDFQGSLTGARRDLINNLKSSGAKTNQFDI